MSKVYFIQSCHGLIITSNDNELYTITYIGEIFYVLLYIDVRIMIFTVILCLINNYCHLIDMSFILVIVFAILYD